MSIQGINHYNNQNYYDVTNVKKTSQKGTVINEEKTDTSSVNVGSKTDESVKSKNNTQQYLNDLQKKNSQINILSGSKNIACKRNDNAKTDVMISPSILNQMASDTQAASKYEKMLAEIPALDKWADSIIHALTGSEVKYRQVWIDEDGNMGSFCITGPSDETKKAHEQAKKEKQEEVEERIKIRREKFQEFSERLEKRSKGEMETAYINSILQQMKVDYMA